jgi:hypothetical protein
MKPTMKAPGPKRLKPRYGKPLSSSAFKFNLRRYIKGGTALPRSVERQVLGACQAQGACTAGAYTRPLFGST